MNPEPLVSVIIPTFNGAKYIGAAIDSILAQTYRHVEVLVVDDGSTDETPAIVRGYGAPVHYVQQSNAGTAAARNTGVRVSRGEIVALLDHDDLWLPRKLERQLPLFERDPKVGLVFAGIEFFLNDTGRVTATYFPAEELSAHDLLAHEVLPIQTVMFRRSALDKVGPFDTALRGTDDWDMSIRMGAEFRVVGFPETLARVRLHETQQGRNADNMFHQAMRVVEKHEHLHPGCRECAAAARKSRGILREDYYGHIKGRAVAAWSEGRRASATFTAVRAFWENPPALWRVLGRCVTGKPA